MLETEVRSPNKYKTWFFMLLSLVIVASVAGGFFYLGKQQTTGQKITVTGTVTPAVFSSKPTITPSESANFSPTKGSEVQFEDEEVVPLGINVVSFARAGDNTYLKYRGKIFQESKAKSSAEEFQLNNPDQYAWYGLAYAPDGVIPNELMMDEVFSFKVAPDAKSFAFVMRWGVKPQSGDFYLFYYNPFDKYRQSLLIKKFPFNDVPVINSFSPDSKYLSLDFFECWNCGGHQPETNLVRIYDNEIKNIGKTSYFKWLYDGKYEYKGYVEIECPSIDYMGPCSEKPENLPLKTGQF